MSDQRVKKWKQLKGSTLRYSFDFNSFADAHALTIADATAVSSATTVATVGNQAVAAGVWVGEITALIKGCTDITVTVTFTGSNIKRIREFCVEVTDPTC